MPNTSSSKGCCHQILFCLCEYWERDGKPCPAGEHLCNLTNLQKCISISNFKSHLFWASKYVFTLCVFVTVHADTCFQPSDLDPYCLNMFRMNHTLQHTGNQPNMQQTSPRAPTPQSKLGQQQQYHAWTQTQKDDGRGMDPEANV